MIKYADTAVVFEEIPDEITLAINISGCPCRCPLCHSKHLWGDVGSELTFDALDSLIMRNKGITCVSFMGGDSEPSYVNELAKHIYEKFGEDIKVGWYSGRDEISSEIDISNFNYIKIGRYDGDFGSLDKKTTNQKLYEILEDGEINDITSKFWVKW